MLRRIFFILLIVTITWQEGSNASLAIANKTPYFVYIGSTTNLVPSGSSEIANYSVSIQQSLYFLSQNAASHEKAQEDCRVQFGKQSSLVSIETLEELGNITKFIQESGNNGTLFWTSGAYKVDTDRQEFQWGTGVWLNPSGPPWDNNHPDSHTLLSRVALHTVGSLKLRTYFNTVSHRYLCEVLVKLN